MVIFNKKLKPPKPRTLRVETVEKRIQNDSENIVLDLGTDKFGKFEFKDGTWIEEEEQDLSTTTTNKSQHNLTKYTAKNNKKDDEIKMMTAKYDILLDLLTELTLNNNNNSRP
jgi:hypothetical protein